MYLKSEITKSQLFKLASERLDHIKKLVVFGKVALMHHKEINAAVTKMLEIPADEMVNDDVVALLVQIAKTTEPYVKLAEDKGKEEEVAV
jgi:hypothetical protein